jgi:hypothetical protein
MTWAHPARNINFKVCIDRDEEKLCPESPVAPISPTLKFTAPDNTTNLTLLRASSPYNRGTNHRSRHLQ